MDDSAHQLFVCSTAGEDAGITGYRMDAGDGGLTELARTPVDHPTYLAAHPDGRTVYAANRVDGGVVSAFQVADGEAGELTPLNDRSSGGEGPCYVSVDPAGEYVFAANYRGGSVAMLPVRGDGSLGDPTVVHHEGSGYVEGRQDAPHPHSVVPGPEGRFVYAPDLGTDRVVAYRVDRDRGRLRADDGASADLPAGSGPRHLEFDRTGRRCYVVNELDSTVRVLDADPADGSLERRGVTGTIPADADAEGNACADVHVHPNDRFVYVSNRGHDSIAVFAAEDGRLRRVGVESTRGENPRDFVLDPAGRFLLAENRDSGSAVTFSVDGGTGALTPTGEGVSLPKPTCACFVGR